MRIAHAVAATLAATLLVTSFASPALAGKKKLPDHFCVFGICYDRNAATPGTPGYGGHSAVESDVQFGTCKNLAGVVGGGNADEDGFCLPYDSMIGISAVPAQAGTPGSPESCTVTVPLYDWVKNGKKKSWTQVGTKVIEVPCSNHGSTPR